MMDTKDELIAELARSREALDNLTASSSAMLSDYMARGNELDDQDELIAELVAALGRYTEAVAALGKSPPERKDSYFEAPLSADGAIERWQELDRAGKVARIALAKARAAGKGGA